MDGFSKYVADIIRYPLLNRQQEIILGRQVQAWLKAENPTKAQIRSGTRAYHKLINCNLRLVVSIAKKYTVRSKRTDMFDIVQEGNIGLSHGIKKFDPERGYALSTYVYWWIRQSISRYLSYHDRMIRMPCHALEMLTKIRIWKPEFEASHGRSPTLEECAEYCDIAPARLRTYMERGEDCVSLDKFIFKMDTETTLLESITNGEHPMENLEVMMAGDYINQLVAHLNDLDREIVEKVFALKGGEPKTYIKVSKEMKMSRERVRQRCQKALRKLKFISLHTKGGSYNAMP
tara:strand:- start:2678 stop:3547 length:870 start_codon:yes stop_codon:yes gene_type:complete